MPVRRTLRPRVLLAADSTYAVFRDEAAFQAEILRVAHQYGWATYHTHDSRGSDKGWPDLVLVRNTQLLFVECKGVRTYVSKAQKLWLAMLQRIADTVASYTGVLPHGPLIQVHLWRAPGDWNEIYRVLR